MRPADLYELAPDHALVGHGLQTLDDVLHSLERHERFLGKGGRTPAGFQLLHLRPLHLCFEFLVEVRGVLNNRPASGDLGLGALPQLLDELPHAFQALVGRLQLFVGLLIRGQLFGVELG